MQNKKQSFLHGAVVLVGAMLIVKVISAFFKIPLTSLIGGDGMGYFSTSYNMFNPICAISVSGLPIAVAKMVAENASLGKYKNVKKIFKIATLFFTGLGMVGVGLMVLAAGPFVKAVNNPDAYISVVVMAPAILFSCLMSIYRGYYEGLRNMYPTAVSQITEAIAKLVLGYFFAFMALNYGLTQFQNGELVYNTAVSTLDEAKAASLPYAAAGAILGVSLSTVFGFTFLFLRHRLKGDGISKQQIQNSPLADKGTTIFKNLVKIALPVSIGAMVLNLTTLIDVSSLMNRIAEAIKINPEAVFSMYEGMIPPTVSAETLPNYLYGTYNSLAVTIFNLVPAITTSIGISALPAVAEAWALKDRKMTGENIETVLKITAMVAIPAGLGLFTFAGPILNVLYGNNPKEVLVATPLLTMMGISVIFTALTTPLYNMLQGVGRADLPVWFILFGGLLKLTGNYILVGIPEINIKGAPIGTLLCYAFIAVASVIALMRITGCSLRFGKTFLGPLISSVLCCTGSYLLYRFISLMVGKITLYPSRLLMACQLAICIIFAVVVYIFSLLTTKSVTKNDILMLPKGEKITKTLEKLKLME